MTSWNHDSNHKTEQVVAVAAATYVINLIAEPSIQDRQKTGTSLEPSLIKGKSRKEDATFSISKPGTISEQFSGEDSMKGSESAKGKVPLINNIDNMESIHYIVEPPDIDNLRSIRAPFKRPLTSADQAGSTSSTEPRRSSSKPDTLSGQPESSVPKPDMPAVKPEKAIPKPDLSTIKPVSTEPKPDHPAIPATRSEQPPTIRPVDPAPAPAPGIEAKRDSTARPGTEQTKADDWEKAEMTKIKERYLKLNSTILAWEEKKKTKARSKLEKAEKSGSEQKRAKALAKFRNEMDYIKQVVDGARAQAQSRQINDVLKAKEKANIIRTTGELPKTCFCC